MFNFKTFIGPIFNIKTVAIMDSLNTTISIRRDILEKLKIKRIDMIVEKKDTKVSYSDVISDLLNVVSTEAVA